MNQSSDEMKYGLVRAPEGYYSVKNLPTQAELRSFYADQYYQNLSTTTYQASYDDEEMAHVLMRNRQTLYSLRQVGGGALGERLLEIGVGEGFFLKVAQESGYVVDGIDFSQYGITAFNPEIAPLVRIGDAFELIDELIGLRETREVIVLQNVLEHVIDPSSMLKGIRSLLSENGVAAIRVPNDYSRLQMSALQQGLIDRPFWYAPPQHLHYFTQNSLRLICEKHGFEICDMFGDFPIEWFLFHGGANYIADPSCGKAAHRARIKIDLLMGENGIEKYHAFCQALAAVEMGRSITAVIRRG